MKVAAVGPTDLVAIFGVGGLGHLALQYAKIAGATVVAVDLNDAKLAMATDLGADYTVDGGHLSALEGLTAETVVLAPLAAALLLFVLPSKDLTWSGHGVSHSILLALSGVATAIPLLLFAAAARRIPLTTIGLLQFMTPIMQLLCGVLVLGEHMSAGRWVGFGLVWLALVALTLDSLQRATRSRRARRVAAAA